MSGKKTGFKPNEVQIGRHYWFVLLFEGNEINCVIKVIELSGNIIWGRILDTEALTFFFSRFKTPVGIPVDEIKDEDLGPEVLTEHLISEVSSEELKDLVSLVEKYTKDFFSVEPPIERRLLN